MEIKFTSFGVPYILEFENVSFVPEKRPTSPSSSTSSFCHIDTPPPPPPRVPFFSLPSPSSLFKRNSRRTVPHEPCANSESTKPLPPPPQSDVSEARGIYIRFPPGCSQPQMTRKERLVHLQQTISAAVLDAGMSRSPANKTRPDEHSNGSTVRGNRGYTTPNALFCGTYGQMIAALEGAGLSATPCTGENLSGYTRLGALFVARNDGASGVQLRKITLWG
ncbi:hypothetical protein L210DRAFT_3391724 [Boletus edulis BED1]|uniref:Uncharacterized protein n=1 Tax=Boletus edulis BED1 TaxID=1328754 RepID=A0AAD4GI30_BOLED|nr:hypothetical protein L210DRAFT_3391724 [Boletus edulis BED1]